MIRPRVKCPAAVRAQAALFWQSTMASRTLTEKKNQTPSLWGVFASLTLYKRNQGRLARQVSACGVILLIAFGCWALSSSLFLEFDRPIRIGVPLAILAAGAWLAFRAVNVARVADFLISVEAEMDKVTWADRSELYRATLVVIGTMLFLGVYLFLADQFWVFLFKTIHFLEI